MASSVSFEIGDRVKLIKGSLSGNGGYVRYVGKVSRKNVIYVGVELDSKNGNHDGKVNGKRYFKCKDKYGLMAPYTSFEYEELEINDFNDYNITGPPHVRSQTNDVMLSNDDNDDDDNNDDNNVELHALWIASCVSNPYGCCCCFWSIIIIMILFGIYILYFPVCLSFNFSDFKVINSKISNEWNQYSLSQETSFSNLGKSSTESFAERRRRRRMQSITTEKHGYSLWSSTDYYYRAVSHDILNVFYYSKETDNILTHELLEIVHSIEIGIKQYNDYNYHSLIYSETDPTIKALFDINQYNKLYLSSSPGSFLNYIYPQIISGKYVFNGNGDVLTLENNNIRETIILYQDIGSLTDFFDFSFDFVNVSSKYLAAVYPFGFKNGGESKDDLFEWVASYKSNYFDKLDSSITNKIGIAVVDIGGIILNNELFYYLGKDLNLAIWSLIIIFIIIYLYCRSFYIAFFGLLGVTLSFIPCFAIYHIIYGESFNLVNMVSIWVILGIGCDDICVFISSYRRSPIESINGKIIPNYLRLSFAYKHAGSAMFVTSFTTSMSFFSLCLSTINPLPQFGWFLGSLVITNFILVMTWFPSILQSYIWFVMIMRKYNINIKHCDKWLAVDIPSPQKYNIKNDVQSIRSSINQSRRQSVKIRSRRVSSIKKNGNGIRAQTQFTNCTDKYIFIMRKGLGFILIGCVLIISCIFLGTATSITLAEEQTKLLPENTNWGQVNIALSNMNIDNDKFSGYSVDNGVSSGSIIITGTKRPSRSPTIPIPTLSPITPIPSNPTSSRPTLSPTKTPTNNPIIPDSPTQSPTDITIYPTKTPTYLYDATLISNNNNTWNDDFIFATNNIGFGWLNDVTQISNTLGTKTVHGIYAETAVTLSRYFVCSQYSQILVNYILIECDANDHGVLSLYLNNDFITTTDGNDASITSSNVFGSSCTNWMETNVIIAGNGATQIFADQSIPFQVRFELESYHDNDPFVVSDISIQCIPRTALPTFDTLSPVIVPTASPTLSIYRPTVIADIWSDDFIFSSSNTGYGWLNDATQTSNTLGIKTVHGIYAETAVILSRYFACSQYSQILVRYILMQCDANDHAVLSLYLNDILMTTTNGNDATITTSDIFSSGCSKNWEQTNIIIAGNEITNNVFIDENVLFEIRFELESFHDNDPFVVSDISVECISITIPTESPVIVPTLSPIINLDPTPAPLPTLPPTYRSPINPTYSCLIDEDDSYNSLYLSRDQIPSGSTLKCSVDRLEDINGFYNVYLQKQMFAFVFEGDIDWLYGDDGIIGCNVYNNASNFYDENVYIPSSSSSSSGYGVKWCFNESLSEEVRDIDFDIKLPITVPNIPWFRLSVWIYYNNTWNEINKNGGNNNNKWYNYTMVSSTEISSKLSIDEALTIYLLFGTDSVTEFITDCDGGITSGELILDSNFNIYDIDAQKRWLDLCDSLNNIKDTIMYRKDGYQEFCFSYLFNEYLRNSSYGPGNKMGISSTSWSTNKTLFNQYISSFVGRSNSILFSSNDYDPSNYRNWFGTKTNVKWYNHNATIRWILQIVRTQINNKWSGATMYEYYLKWDDFINDFNSKSPSSFKGIQTSSAYVRMEVEVAFIDGFIKSVAYTIILCSIVMMFFTQNLYLVLLVCLYILIVCIWVIGLFGAAKWPFGIIEIISVPTIIGLTIDYALHITHAYIYSPFPDRLRRTKSSINDLGSSIFTSAMTTILSMFILYFATIIIFSDLGWVVGSTTTFGVFLALFVCPSCLMYTGPQYDQCHFSWFCPNHMNGIQIKGHTFCSNKWHGKNKKNHNNHNNNDNDTENVNKTKKKKKKKKKLSPALELETAIELQANPMYSG